MSLYDSTIRPLHTLLSSVHPGHSFPPQQVKTVPLERMDLRGIQAHRDLMGPVEPAVLLVCTYVGAVHVIQPLRLHIKNGVQEQYAKVTSHNYCVS